MMKIIKYPNRNKWSELLKRPAIKTNQLEKQVSKVLNDVKLNGDKAVQKYTLQFDKVDLKNILVTKKEFLETNKKVSKELKDAIKVAKSNITKFHSSQIEKTKIVETTKGVKCWRNSVAIEKVGLYIPGGTAPL